MRHGGSPSTAHAAAHATPPHRRTWGQSAGAVGRHSWPRAASGRPVHSTVSSTPRLYTSALVVQGMPSSCSGAAMWRVVGCKEVAVDAVRVVRCGWLQAGCFSQLSPPHKHSNRRHNQAPPPQPTVHPEAAAPTGILGGAAHRRARAAAQLLRNPQVGQLGAQIARQHDVAARRGGAWAKLRDTLIAQRAPLLLTQPQLPCSRHPPSPPGLEVGVVHAAAVQKGQRLRHIQRHLPAPGGGGCMRGWLCGCAVGWSCALKPVAV